MRYLLKQLENNAKAFDIDDEMLGEDSDDPFLKLNQNIHDRCQGAK